MQALPMTQPSMCHASLQAFRLLRPCSCAPCLHASLLSLPWHGLQGFGSYPERVQSCPVFQLLGQQAQRFYLLFQHATSPAHAAKDGYIVNPGASEREFSAFHFVTQLGPSAFVVAPDGRSQRTRQHIIAEDSYKRIETAVRAALACAAERSRLVLSPCRVCMRTFFGSMSPKCLEVVVFHCSLRCSLRSVVWAGDA